MDNGKILQFIKKHYISIACAIGVLVLAFIGVRSCQRHLDIDFKPSRNRITIVRNNVRQSRGNDCVTPKKRKKDVCNKENANK